MFTGLVTDVGRVASVEDANGIRRVTVRSKYRVEQLQMGASVQHSGVCLTLVEFGPDNEGSWWVVEAIPETLSRTTLGSWKPDTFVNLELSLKLGDELGGHLVYGHVDGLGQLAEIRQVGESRVMRVSIPQQLSKFFAEKGSVTIDGVSLTVSAVSAAARGRVVRGVADPAHAVGDDAGRAEGRRQGQSGSGYAGAIRRADA
jgi:riboflavin synthase